ncbi:MAG: F0F1 ATP synthase subunit A, partial [Pseudomonadota bacterium]
MADDASGTELVFHPMDQFIVKPLFGDGPVGLF